MAIPVTNAAWTTQGPTKTGQILAGNPLSEAETALIGTTTIVLDGTLLVATVNFIDGTQVLNAAPTAIIATACGGTQQAVAAVGVQSVTAITATSFTVALTGAGTAANTLKIAFIAVK